MTQIERLIRNICDDARKRLDTDNDAAVSAIAEKVKVKDAPVAVRRALGVLKAFTPRLEAAKATIKRHGFDVPNMACVCEDEHGPDVLGVEYKHRNSKLVDIRGRHHQRRARVNTLQNSAVVATLGMRGEQAKSLLDKLTRDLAGL